VCFRSRRHDGCLLLTHRNAPCLLHVLVLCRTCDACQAAVWLADAQRGRGLGRQSPREPEAPPSPSSSTTLGKRGRQNAAAQADAGAAPQSAPGAPAGDAGAGGAAAPGTGGEDAAPPRAPRMQEANPYRSLGARPARVGKTGTEAGRP